MLALQQRRRAAGSLVQATRTGSLPAQMQLPREPQPSFAVHAAGVQLQQQLGDNPCAGLAPGPEPTASVAASAVPLLLHQTRPAWAQQAASSQLHVAEHSQQWQPQRSLDPSQPQLTPPRRQHVQAGSWQGPPAAPQLAPKDALLPAFFTALQPPSQTDAAAAAISTGFPPLAAALQRRHTWSNVTAPVAKSSASPGIAALAAQLLQQAGALPAWTGHLAQQQQQVTLCKPLSCSLSHTEQE